MLTRPIKGYARKEGAANPCEHVKSTSYSVIILINYLLKGPLLSHVFAVTIREGVMDYHVNMIILIFESPALDNNNSMHEALLE